jgi:hypothetical protein
MEHMFSQKEITANKYRKLKQRNRKQTDEVKLLLKDRLI